MRADSSVPGRGIFFLGPAPAERLLADVELFASNIVEAGQRFIDEPNETPFVPRWNRVRYAIPDIMDQIKNAVDADNATTALKKTA